MLIARDDILGFAFHSTGKNRIVTGVFNDHALNGRWSHKNSIRLDKPTNEIEAVAKFGILADDVRTLHDGKILGEQIGRDDECHAFSESERENLCWKAMLEQLCR